MQEKIAFLLKPIKILMDKFYLRGKFSTIIIVILIGYLPAAYYIYTTLKSSLDMLNSEITGTNYLSSIQNAYYQTVLTATSNPTIDRARQLASIKKDIDELIHLKKNVSDQLKLSAQLQELSDELSKGDNTDRYYFNLLSRFQALLSSVINNSQLILDPSPNTFPLIDGILNQMPLLLSEYKQYQNIQSTNNQPTQIPAINEQHPKLAIQQAILASRIAERINTIKSDLNNTSLLNKNLQSYVANTSALLRSITAKIVDAAQGSQKSEVSPMLIESINKNLIEGQELIRGQLEQRKNNLETQSLLIFITVGLAVILMIYCVLGVIVAIKESLLSLTDSIRLIASGNLAQEIKSTHHDEFGKLLDELSQMQDELFGVVNQISEVSRTVNSSAQEIAAGNSNLSERTQDQASCLVETSATLDNLTGTTKKNAESAKEAADLAHNATYVAQKGGEAVNQVITTMGDINESAHKIQEITGVIDSIAFQTNLLALNASVEAARAGEQGRGFAVVASEVRNLAQRSAEAAKQIKGLINDSMVKVVSGDAQVKITYSNMQDIVNSIENVNELVAKIAVASNEQSSSIEQINIVISQLEGNTQQNTAQVEEVAASAELLKEQSSKLVGIVQQFNIDKEEQIIKPQAININARPKSPPPTQEKMKLPQDKKQAANEKNINNDKKQVASAVKVVGGNDNFLLNDEDSWKEF